MGEQKPKKKSVIEQMREIDRREAEREAQAEAERQARIEAIEKQEKEAYAEQLRQERLELLRLKQDESYESETIHEEKEEQKKYTFWQKLSNFFYHNIWWMGITVFIGGILLYLILDQVLKIRPDMIVMVLTDDAFLQENPEALKAYFEQFVDDENGDKRQVVDIYCIPVNDSIGENDYYTGDATKLSAEFHLADSVLVLTDETANEFIVAEKTLSSMEKLYPDDAHAKGVVYLLADTPFKERLGGTGTLDADIGLALRTPIKTYDSIEEMQENYEIARKVLDRVIDDLN